MRGCLLLVVCGWVILAMSLNNERIECCDQVASWGAYLLQKDILAMSFAPRDTHVSQIQFALERGVPAILGIMAVHRMPYPARAFDMAHCSRCLIPWGGHGKIKQT
jgi:hypothetical protein